MSININRKVFCQHVIDSAYTPDSIIIPSMEVYLCILFYTSFGVCWDFKVKKINGMARKLTAEALKTDSFETCYSHS